MKEKYFTPDISEIHVGYECETRQFTGGNWFKCIIDEEMYYADDNGLYRNNCPLFYIETYFRTPYLTKEQIEKEGWKYVEGVKTQIFKTFVGEYIEDDDCTGVEYRMYYTASTHRISVEALTISYGKAQYNCYEGNCNLIFRGKIKCINEFRNILKYLCINT